MFVWLCVLVRCKVEKVAIKSWDSWTFFPEIKLVKSKHESLGIPRGYRSHLRGIFKRSKYTPRRIGLVSTTWTWNRASNCLAVKYICAFLKIPIIFPASNFFASIFTRWYNSDNFFLFSLQTLSLSLCVWFGSPGPILRLIYYYKDI